MGFPGPARAWRGAMLACGLAWFASATGSRAVALDSPGATEPVAQSSLHASLQSSLGLAAESAEPFGLPASVVFGGGLRAKWLGVARTIDDERVQLALCDGDREGCASDAALRLLAIVDSARARDGRARLGEINRAINLAIRPTSDLAQYGEIDVWSSPLVTLAKGAGDCEDYAIAKFVALRLAGVPAEDLRIVVMRDLLQGEDHAVAAARLDGQWLMLDNRRMAMIDDAHVRNYRPLFVLDESAVMKYADTPLLAGLPDREPAPATAPNQPVAQ
jgi:predicted transglutaminase-like cysteine proteinase